MGKRTDRIKMARPGEPEVVKTTIVGGRPPGGGAIPRHIPRGIEILIKKAAVDPAFKTLLLDKRAAAAEAIALSLDAAEEAMLEAVPEAQLRAIIMNTKVSPSLRPAFLGYAAAAMLAALGAAAYAEDPDEWEMRTTGIDAEMPPKAETADNEDINVATECGTVSGSVTDEKGKPIENALVVVCGTNRFASTDANGRYLIEAVPVGVYEVKASRAYYKEEARFGCKVLPDTDTTLSFGLRYTGAGVTGIRPDLP